MSDLIQLWPSARHRGLGETAVAVSFLSFQIVGSEKGLGRLDVNPLDD